MNKSVLISIQPQWCQLIARGVKTIEVRKTAPKLDTPFKCYIYCTKNNGYMYLCRLDENRLAIPEVWNGKVIGEFVCDSVENIACHKYHNGIGFDYTYYTESLDTLTNETQLTEYDMQQYLGRAEDGECVGYAWHISNLKIYDKPKELIDFKKDGFMTEEQWLYALYPNTHCHYAAWANRFEIARPPQSWCYCNIR